MSSAGAAKLGNNASVQWPVTMQQAAIPRIPYLLAFSERGNHISPLNIPAFACHRRHEDLIVEKSI